MSIIERGLKVPFLSIRITHCFYCVCTYTVGWVCTPDCESTVFFDQILHRVAGDYSQLITFIF